MLNTFNAYRNIDSIRNTELSSYKIGAVSRITGIGSETLRAWERRYAAVVPSRAESGDRQYSRDDVAKLLLLKTLVDSGISIGTIAKLSIDELKEHVEFNVNNQQHYEINTPKAHKFLDVDCSVALFGDCFPLRILDGLEEVQGINVVGTYDTFQEYQQRLDTNQQINVAIIEKPTINDDIHEEITKNSRGNRCMACHCHLWFCASRSNRAITIHASLSHSLSGRCTRARAAMHFSFRWK